jgi:DNA-binding transcriptional ArsR family regulator
VDAVAQALADPIRRDILRMLRSRPTTAGAIAGAFSVSRPAVSRHLRVLRVAGLVRDRVRGREREYRLDLAPLDPLLAFVDDLRTDAAGWQRRFLALETEVHRVRNRRRREPRVAAHDPTAAKETA